MFFNRKKDKKKKYEENQKRKEIIKAMKEEGENIVESTKTPLFDKVSASMPNPPKEEVEWSEFLTLVKKHFSTAAVAAVDFVNLIHMEMIINHSNSRIVTVDARRYLEFSLQDNVMDIQVFLVDRSRGEKNELTYENMESVLWDLIEELQVFSDKQKRNHHDFVLYDTSFLRKDITDETPEEKQIRYQKIDELYMMLKKDGRFTDNQLATLYKFMHKGLDINCFACYLFSVSQMEFLESIYTTAVKNKLNEAEELEEFCKSFHKFCVENFTTRFSISQFSRLFNAANEGKHEELIRHPEFDLIFELDGLVDDARDSADGKYECRLDDKKLVISAWEQRDSEGYVIDSGCAIELEDVLIFDTKIHEFDFDKEPLCVLKDLYYRSHKTIQRL